MGFAWIQTESAAESISILDKSSSPQHSERMINTIIYAWLIRVFFAQTCGTPNHSRPKKTNLNVLGCLDFRKHPKISKNGFYILQPLWFHSIRGSLNFWNSATESDYFADRIYRVQARMSTAKKWSEASLIKVRKERWRNLTASDGFKPTVEGGCLKTY